MITIKDLSFRYGKRKPVLQHFTLNLDKGGVYGVLGANGVGKTTLLHLMSGLLFPQSGQLEVGGNIPSRRGVSFLERVFYVPVTFDLPALRIAEYGKRYAPFYPKFDRNAWKNALMAFEIPEKEQIKNLSFGQKKKVLLSFALSSACEFLLFDEPTDGLDIPSKDAFRRLLAQQINEQSLAVITTHHVQDVAMLLDHLIILKGHGLLLDASLTALAVRFQTVLANEVPSGDVTLYAERVPGGYHCLVRNTEGREGPLNLELLFKNFTITTRSRALTPRYE